MLLKPNTMKLKLIFPILFIFSLSLKSQEVSVNPFALLFEGFIFGADYNINDDFGIGADLAFGQGLGLFYVNGKHYFNPKKGNDRWMLGSFIGGAGEFGGGDGGAGLGFFVGYKWISRRNIVFELAGGAGRDFSGDIGFLPYYKFNVGYRFKKKDPDTNKKKKRRR